MGGDFISGSSIVAWSGVNYRSGPVPVEIKETIE